MRQINYFFFICGLICGMTSLSFGQTCHLSIKGYILDQHDLSALSYANITISGTTLGAQADSLGYYEIKGLCKGNYTLICSHIGCEPVKRKIFLEENVTNFNFYPEHHAHELQQIFIRARTNQEITNVSNKLDEEQLLNMKTAGLSMNLASIPGLSILTTGSNIEKPIIHGLFGSRIAIVQQSSRLEDQQWGNDHAPNIDVQLYDKIEIIKGAASVRFGAKAMGGAILLDQKPIYTDTSMTQEVVTKVQTNPAGFSLAGVFQKGLPRHTKSGWKLAFGVKKYGDQSSPDFTLSNTGTTGANIGLSIGTTSLSQTHRLTLSGYYNNAGILAASQVNSQEDIIRAIESKRPLIIHPPSFSIDAPRQQSIHSSVSYNGRINVTDDHKFKMNASYQQDNRQEFDVRRGGLTNVPAVNMNLHTLQLEFLDDRRWNDILSGTIGVNVMGQLNINNPDTRRRPIIPYYHLVNPGIFTYQQVNLKKITLEAGIRGDFQFLGAKYYDLNQKLHQPKRNFNNVVYNIGLFTDFHPQIHFKANTGIAYRAPEVNELYSNGVHLSSVAYEVGDPNLKSEQVWKTIVEFSNDKSNTFHYSLDIYYQRFHNYIYQQPNGFISTIAGVKLRYDYVQTNGTFSGFDALIRYNPTQRWTLESNLSGIRSKNQTTGLGMPLIPPFRVTGEVEHILMKNKKWASQVKVGLQYQYVARQKYFNPTEIFTSPPPDYSLFDIHLKYLDKSEKHQFEVAIKNVFNTRYSNYLNNLRYFAPQEVGRNWSIQYIYKIREKKN